MAEENEKTASGARRFRLPKLFAENEGETADEYGAEGGEPGHDDDAALDPAAGQFAAETAGGNMVDGSTHGSGDEVLEYVAGMAQELLAMRGALSHMTQQLEEINQRESAQERVFDTLHAELGDYKKDFIYERLKPIVRPLLFLYDSLEQFDDEVALHEKPDDAERRGLSPRLVRENVAYFRDQLVEALHVCQVTQMDKPRGVFNAKLHKAMAVEPVSPEQHGQILRVLRSGWFLNGQLLRPAEVVVGKAEGKAARPVASREPNAQ